MLIPEEKISEAKQIYNGQAMKDIVEYLGVAEWNEQSKKGLCPFHADVNPSFIWNEKNNSFHCFAKETKVMTKNGNIPIIDLVDKKTTIINGIDEWEEVVFRNCGKQKLMKLILIRSDLKKTTTIYATPEHEWLIEGYKEKIQTQDLQKDYKLQGTMPLHWKVVNVEETDRYEDVYCCETSTHSFYIEDRILTGNCFGCNKNYDIINLYLDEGMTYLEAVAKLFEDTNIEYNFSMRGVHSKSSYKYPLHEDKELSAETLVYWGKRKISKKTLDYLDVKEDNKGNTVFHFYDENDVLLSVKYKPSRKINANEPKCWFQKDYSNTPILFNMNRVDPSKPLVITEGEPDCMAVIEAGYPNAVSVPNGCNNTKWIEQCWDWLEQFKKIIIWCDNDEPGIKARNDICNRLGTWRTYYIEITDRTPSGKPIKDANELLYRFDKEKVLDYINAPTELPVEGVLDLANVTPFDIQTAEGLYTGIEDLDNQIYKIVLGTVNIVTGKSGEGKSVFVNQVAICQALEQNYDVFVFSGELPAPVLKTWVEVNMIGRENMDLIDGGHVRQFHKKAQDEMREWYSGRIMVYDDNLDTTASTLLHKMEEMARKFGTKVFVIDNLMMVDLECDDESRLQAEKNFIKDLINFAKKFNVLVWLVAHPRKTGEIRVTKEDIAGSSNIANLAHMVFSVHRYSDNEKEGELNNRGTYSRGKEPVEYDSVVEVLKNRITGIMPKIDLYFDYPSYRFYRTPRELWHRYKWDMNKEPLNTKDPNEEMRRKERMKREGTYPSELDN